MLIKSLKFFLLPALVMVAILVACNKNEDVSVDDAIDQALYSAQERGSIGKFGCFELVFPVTITLPDNSTAVANGYEDIKNALRTYFQANGTGGHHGHMRPHLSFVYPIAVTSQEGELITIDNAEGLIALRAECGGGTFGNHDIRGHGHHLSCFEITFPVTIEFPDSTTAIADSREAFHQLVRTWRENNPGVTGRPKMVFPITVKMTEDGTLVTVNNRDELHALKESCE